MALSNCPRCGKLFDNTFKDICQACTHEEEKLYQLARKYIKEHKECTIYEASEETGVPVKTIARFIQQGRIHLKNNPNMMYPCEGCGTPIAAGKFCIKCTSELQKGFTDITKQHKDEQKQKLTKDKKVGYHFDDFKK